MKKKLTLLVALLLVAFVAVGCGENEESTDNYSNESAVVEEKDTEPQKALIEGAGQEILELTEGISYFTIVESIEVYEQGDKKWAVVKTGEIKDYDDGGWCKEIAKLVILNAYKNVAYLDEVFVTNADGIQIASERNWLSKE